MLFALTLALGLSGQASAHIALWHPSMFGFNASSDNNRPVDPLMGRHFNTSDEHDSWWYHGHLIYPPHENDIMQLPVGGALNAELSCDKGTTSWWPSAPGGNTASVDQPDYPCPGQPLSQFHTTAANDTGGCALAVAYKSNAWEVKPEDFAVFSVNQTCVWTKNTTFPVPANMPPCPNGKCQCAFFWGHQADSGSAQIYMNGFQCNMDGATNDQPLPPPNPARRCGEDIYLNRPADPSNCTIGAKQPNYWHNLEGNNQFEDIMEPPSYQALYGFMDGAQTDLYDGVGKTQPTGSQGSASKRSLPTEPPRVWGHRRMLGQTHEGR
ncbi:hypothetical protein PENSPDRAFT_652542 [Peniophora sp. CONT]|nr:hypothetical protein PENSPDRAFT_652542 [Peniophora sp. CONT]